MIQSYLFLVTFEKLEIITEKFIRASTERDAISQFNHSFDGIKYPILRIYQLTSNME